jgi:hypothetical protein
VKCLAEQGFGASKGYLEYTGISRMEVFKVIFQGLVTVPFWVYWTSPYSSHGIDHIPNGWVMFNGDI